MAASISYGREESMTSQDVEDVMESVYIVYQRRLQEAAEKGENLRRDRCFHIALSSIIAECIVWGNCLAG